MRTGSGIRCVAWRLWVAAVLLAVSAAFAATPYYVDDARPDDGGSGLSWATAKKTIQAAVDLTANGDTVWVTNGTYSITTQISIAKGITVRSVNGPEVTTIQRDAAAGYFRVIEITDTAADAVVDGFTIRNGNVNTTGLANGGNGIRMTAAATITNCVVRDNILSGGSGNARYGGGVYMTAGTVIDSLIINNTGAGAYHGDFGGGVYMTGGLLRDCLIVSNTLGRSYQRVGGGGGVYATGGEVMNSLLVFNVAELGGGYRGGGQLVNCTIAGNASVEDRFANPGPGAGVFGNTGFQAENTIVYANTNHLGWVSEYDGTVSFIYSCTQPLPAGTGNVDGNPGFLDASAGNFRLRPGSPAIDAGMNAAWMADAVDLDGASRVYPEAGTVDMGAYEYRPGALGCYFVADQTTGMDTLQVAFTATVDGTNQTGLVYAWDFNANGTADQTGTGLVTVTNTYSAGWYDVSLTVSNAIGEVSTFSRTAYIKVSPSLMYVATNGAHVPPFATWADAATDIQAPLALAVSGSVIRVSDGVYTVDAETQSLQIETALTLESVNGPEVTVIQRSSGNVRVLDITPTAGGSVLSGFTIRDGNYGHGAGIRMLADAVITNCIVRDNALSGQSLYGGGIHMSAGRVVDSRIADNSISSGYWGNFGGGVYMSGGELFRCMIISNEVGRSTALTYNPGGGGVYAEPGARVVNSLVAFNRSDVGAGMRGGGSLESCTIIANMALSLFNGDPGLGAGVYGNTGFQATNTIVFANTNHVGSASEYGGTVSFVHSCTQPLPAGAGNVDDALFLDVSGGNFRLRVGSPAIDSGTNLAWMAGTTDLDGNDRILPVDGIVDMGAYEYMTGALSCSFAADVTEGFGNLDVVLTSTVDGTNLTGVTYHWDLTGDGMTDLGGSEYATVTNNYGPGLFTVTLTVSNQVGESSSLTRENYILVAPAQMFVATNGAHISPFLTWADAATDIQSAINMAASGTVITVANGVYDQALTLTIDIPLLLQSLNGPDTTIIRLDPAASNTRVLLLDDGAAGAVVSGFTLRDGNRATTGSDGGSGVRMLADATITNCVIRDNILSGGSGHARYGAGVYMTTGRIVNSQIINNSAPDAYWGNYGGGVYLGGGELVNCVITNNSAGRRTEGSGGGGGVHAVAGTRMVNCLLANNEATDGGGLRGAAALMNCTVVGNTALTTVSGAYGNTGGILGAAGFAATNTIVYANTNHVGDVSNYSGTTVFRYSLSTPKPDGEGNITDDPLFVDADGGDYRLQVKPVVSPAIDAGTPPPSKGAPYEDDQAWINTAVDLAGQPRYLNEAVDMGAYEMFVPRTRIVIMMR